MTTPKTDSEISRETIGKHEKILTFHAHPNGSHTMSVFIDGYLDQYISLTDEAIDAIVSMRDAMKGRIKAIDERTV